MENESPVMQCAMILVMYEIGAARDCLHSAIIWAEVESELSHNIVKHLMDEYHLHVRIAYALNELFGTPISVYNCIRAL